MRGIGQSGPDGPTCAARTFRKFATFGGVIPQFSGQATCIPAAGEHLVRDEGKPWSRSPSARPAAGEHLVRDEGGHDFVVDCCRHALSMECTEKSAQAIETLTWLWSIGRFLEIWLLRFWWGEPLGFASGQDVTHFVTHCLTGGP
jgi:hypothetical protein